MEKQEIKKAVIITTALILLFVVFIASIVFVSQYFNKWHPGPKSVTYKDVPGTMVPNKCIPVRGDTCQLFDCMIEDCWCDTRETDNPVLYEEEGVEIKNTGDAENLVQKYLGENTGIEIEEAYPLNKIFYNVYCDKQGQEIVYTVAVDGTIIKTQCGV
jgi:hypothetical protein